MRNIMRLGDVASYINGFPFKPSDWSDMGVPIIRIQDLTGNGYQMNRFDGKYDAKYEVRAGDVLISWSASLGVYVWKLETAVLNQHIFKVRFDKVDVDKDFFVYQVECLLKKAARQAHGATMRHLTKPVFDGLPFYLPPKEEQKRIAVQLNAITHLISLRQRQAEKLDELVKARFVEMFGDPVLNCQGFPVRTIGELTTEVKYGTSKPAVEGGKYPYLRMNNLTIDGKLDLHDLKQIDVDTSEFEKCVVRKGDVLFNRTNSAELVGKTAYYGLDEEMIIAGYIIRVRVNNLILPQYLSFYMNMPFMKQRIRSMAKGAVNQANINSKELKSIKVIVPPLEVQGKVVEYEERIDREKDRIQRSAALLETLKRSLMQQYFG